MRGSILTIGNEILIGQIVDTNSAWLGSKMEHLGIKISESRSVPDDENRIIKAIGDLLEDSDLIIMTGGLGPTQDDITKRALARYLKVEMEFSTETYDRIKSIFEKRSIPFKDAHHHQCNLPKGCTLLYNQLGTAPGMWFEKDDKVIISMPGVPFEMKSIFDNNIVEKLAEKFDLGFIYHKTIMTAGLPESSIEDMVQPIVNEFPKNLSIAFLPNLSTVRIRLSGVSDDDQNIGPLIDGFAERMVDVLGDIVYGFDEVSLGQTVQNLFIEKGLKLAMAESCTGGAMAKKITSVSGCSQYFEGSVVAYSYDIKMKLLGVKQETLLKYGAVSQEVVEQMVQGVFNNMGVDVGMAISGVMGPLGGTDDKPVGTIWLAWGSRDNILTKKILLGKDRIQNIEYCVNYALNALRKFLMAQ